jgi:hypothetical protein
MGSKRRRAKAKTKPREAAMAETHKKYGPNEQVPTDVFTELATSHEELSLRVLRKNDLGHLLINYIYILFEKFLVVIVPRHLLVVVCLVKLAHNFLITIWYSLAGMLSAESFFLTVP